MEYLGNTGAAGQLQGHGALNENWKLLSVQLSFFNNIIAIPSSMYSSWSPHEERRIAEFMM